MYEKCPDYFPEDWDDPKVVQTNWYTHKKYKDGTEVFIDGEEGAIEDTETRFPDGSVHYEQGLDTDIPEYHKSNT